MTPSHTCCEGTQNQNVLQQSITTPIRKALCECFENAAKAFHIIPDGAKQLSKSCKIKVFVPLYPVSTATCNLSL